MDSLVVYRVYKVSVVALPRISQQRTSGGVHVGGRETGGDTSRLGTYCVLCTIDGSASLASLVSWADWR